MVLGQPGGTGIGECAMNRDKKMRGIPKSPEDKAAIRSLTDFHRQRSEPVGLAYIIDAQQESI